MASNIALIATSRQNVRYGSAADIGIAREHAAGAHCTKETYLDCRRSSTTSVMHRSPARSVLRDHAEDPDLAAAVLTAITGERG